MPCCQIILFCVRFSSCSSVPISERCMMHMIRFCMQVLRKLITRDQRCIIFLFMVHFIFDHGHSACRVGKNSGLEPGRRGATPYRQAAKGASNRSGSICTIFEVSGNKERPEPCTRWRGTAKHRVPAGGPLLHELQSAVAAVYLPQSVWCASLVLIATTILQAS
jgi:hypothetical protein